MSTEKQHRNRGWSIEFSLRNLPIILKLMAAYFVAFFFHVPVNNFCYLPSVRGQLQLCTAADGKAESKVEQCSLRRIPEV